MEHDVLQAFSLKGSLSVCLNLRKDPQKEIIHY